MKSPGRLLVQRREGKCRGEVSWSLIEVGYELIRAGLGTNVFPRFHRHEFAVRVRWPPGPSPQ